MTTPPTTSGDQEVVFIASAIRFRAATDCVTTVFIKPLPCEHPAVPTGFTQPLSGHFVGR